MLMSQTILLLDEVINMLAALRDAAAADAYSALLPSDSVDDNVTTTQMSQHPPSTATHSQQQQQPARRRVPLRPTSVASVDLRDPDEM